MVDEKQPDPMIVMRRIIRIFRTLPKSERVFLIAKLNEINEELRAASSEE